MIRALLVASLVLIGSAFPSVAQVTDCKGFSGFPLSLNLGIAPRGIGGESERCMHQKSQDAINALVGTRGQPNGTATLDSNGLVPISQIPATVALPTSVDKLTLTGVPGINATFIGSGLPSWFKMNLVTNATKTDQREIGAQFGMYSDVGNSNPAADKIALFYASLGTINSAPIYGANGVAQGYAGPGGYLLTGFESDVNNLGDHADTFGNQSSYGVVAVAAGTKRSTAGFWATGASSSWNFGFAVTDYANKGATQAGFYDGSSSPVAFMAGNQHVTLLDGTTASSIGTGMALPNNTTAIKQMTTGGVLTQVIKLNAGNGIEIGDPTLPAIQLQSLTYINAAALSLTGGPRMLVPGAADSCGTGYRCLRVPN